MTNKEKQQSAGLAFMLAAKAAIPRSLGDRERISVMQEAMGIAVRARFAFDTVDAGQLERLNISTCVGKYRSFDKNYYRQACAAGGTYPKMWEHYKAIKPWRATTAFLSAVGRTYGPLLQLDNNRVCWDAAVLMPQSFCPETLALASHEGQQVWWVTEMTDKTINLCRYLPSEGYEGNFRHPGGAPARRRTLTREEWAFWQTALAAQLDKPFKEPTWTDDDDIAAFSKGWRLTSFRGRNLIKREGFVKFETDEAAVTYVREQAARGDVVAVKALIIHELALQKPVSKEQVRGAPKNRQVSAQL